MDPDETRGLALVVVEVLVPGPVVDDDQVAGLPGKADAVELAVAAAGHHVEPGLATVPVARLVEARCQLVHDRGEPGGVVADGLVDQEEAARTPLGDEPAPVVEAPDQPRAVGAGPL